MSKIPQYKPGAIKVAIDTIPVIPNYSLIPGKRPRPWFWLCMLTLLVAVFSNVKYEQKMKEKDLIIDDLHELIEKKEKPPEKKKSGGRRQAYNPSHCA